MAYQSTHRLQEDMDRVEQELEAALVLERAAKDRHAEEGLPETEAVLEARRTRTAHLRKERVGFLEELRRRAVKEKGWKPDAAEETGTDGAPARSPGCYSTCGAIPLSDMFIIPSLCSLYTVCLPFVVKYLHSPDNRR
jgi:hypothetical protein